MYKVWLELDEDYVPSGRHRKSCLFFKFPVKGLRRVVPARHNFVQNRQNEQGAGLAQNAQLRALLQRVFAE